MSCFGANAVRLLDASYAVFEDAARLRARRAWRHQTRSTLRQLCALAARLFITNDTDFRRVEGLPLVVLDDLLTEES